MVSNQSTESLEEIFKELRPKYEKLCEETKRIVIESFSEKEISFQNIDARAKSIESFLQKAKKTNGSEPKYPNPIVDITDIAGVRIITYTIKDLEKVDRFIAENFDIVEKRDVGEERYKEGKFGYQSIHYLVKFPENRLLLSENKKYSGLICEIQIRTVLQHAWAEIEHDIQYKNRSDVPRALERRFIALAGLLEIADREFQTIQDEDAKLKKTVDESLQDEVTRFTISSNSTDVDEPVKILVRANRYSEAIVVYNDKITNSPTMHTLYLGRAKVKFLSGDRQGALDDIDHALILKPDDAAGLKLRNQVVEGASDYVTPPLGDINEANELTREANELIEKGDGISAFELYSRAQEKGASKPFSTMNKAIACFLASDFDGALYFVSSLRRRLGTPMSISVIALHCLVYALNDPDKFTEEMANLDQALGANPDFTFSMSPLAKLRRGIGNWPIKMDAGALARVEAVFELISN